MKCIFKNLSSPVKPTLTHLSSLIPDDRTGSSFCIKLPLNLKQIMELCLFKEQICKSRLFAEKYLSGHFGFLSEIDLMAQVPASS